MKNALLKNIKWDIARWLQRKKCGLKSIVFKGHKYESINEGRFCFKCGKTKKLFRRVKI